MLLFKVLVNLFVFNYMTWVISLDSFKSLEQENVVLLNPKFRYCLKNLKAVHSFTFYFCVM
jgi:hypothetical protein